MAKSSRPNSPKAPEEPAKVEAEGVAHDVDQPSPDETESDGKSPAEPDAIIAETVVPDPIPAVVQEEPQVKSGVEPEPVSPEPPKPERAETHTVREVRVERRGGFLGVVAGGVLAAAAGYAVATYFPVAPPKSDDAPLAAVEAAQAALDARLGAIDSTLSGMSDRLAAMDTALAATTQAAAPDLSGIEASLGALAARLDAIEAMPPSGDGASNAAIAAAIEQLRSEIDGLKGQGAAATETIQAMADEAAARLAEAEAQAAQLKAEAEEVARNARLTAALGRVQAALESGAPYEQALAELEGITPAEPLLRYASSGVPTVTSLSEGFPPAARAALEAARRATVGDGLGERVAAFLENATGARSLAPREGNDPDAILSRAEASVRTGDLKAAIAEIAALPPEGQAPLAEWVAEAEGRIAALDAMAALTAEISG